MGVTILPRVPSGIEKFSRAFFPQVSEGISDVLEAKRRKKEKEEERAYLEKQLDKRLAAKEKQFTEQMQLMQDKFDLQKSTTEIPQTIENKIGPELISGREYSQSTPLPSLQVPGLPSGIPPIPGGAIPSRQQRLESTGFRPTGNRLATGGQTIERLPEVPAAVKARLGQQQEQFGQTLDFKREQLAQEAATSFKPFQMSAQDEQDFNINLQNAANLLKNGTINPATGEAFTRRELFLKLAAAYPSQASRLKTILLSGKETEDFGNVVFGD
jgi:hypothetical protein